MGLSPKVSSRTGLMAQTSANFKELGGNPKKGFLAGGISAGGNFGAILALLYRDENLSPPLTGSYLSIPACMTAESVPEKYKAVFLSREQNASTPILNKSSIKLFDRQTPLSHISAIYLNSNIFQVITIQTNRPNLHIRSISNLTQVCRRPIFRFVAWTPSEMRV
jgi:hypothetical protein